MPEWTDTVRGGGMLAAVTALAVALGPAVALGAPPASDAPEIRESKAKEPPSQDANDPIEIAKAKVTEGQALYEQARYEEALAAFQDAAAAYASPDFQFNIGLCYERLGEPEAAIRAFETYLRNKPDAPDKPSVQHRIDQLRAQLERDQSPPPAAAVTSPAADPSQRQGPRPQPFEDRTSAERKPAKPLIVSGATLLAVGGVVALGGGIGFGVPASDRTRKVEDALEGGNPRDLTAAETRTLAEQGDRFRGLQLGSIGAGVALAAVGAGLLAVGLKRRRLADVAFYGGPRGAGIGATLVF